MATDETVSDTIYKGLQEYDINGHETAALRYVGQSRVVVVEGGVV